MDQTTNQSQVDEFFKNLPDEDKKDADIFDNKKPAVIEPKVDEDDPEKAPESIKDRRHRRLEARLQQERETNIELNAILKTRSEQEKFVQDNSGDVDARILRMFPADEGGKQNALILSQILNERGEAAKEDAIQSIKAEQAQAIQEQKQYETLIDNELESLEDEHNVDLTSDSPKARKTRREFLEMVQQLSPKDDEGNITGYADFGSTFDVYQKTLTEEKPNNTRREEIADRSMKRSNSNTETVKKITPGFDGWKRDYGV